MGVPERWQIVHVAYVALDGIDIRIFVVILAASEWKRKREMYLQEKYGGWHGVRVFKNFYFTFAYSAGYL